MWFQYLILNLILISLILQKQANYHFMLIHIIASLHKSYALFICLVMITITMYQLKVYKCYCQSPLIYYLMSISNDEILLNIEISSS